MRRSLVIGNWKMNGTLASAQLLAKGIIAGLGSADADIAVCVPYVYLPAINELVKDTALGLGSQNIADKASGAYTGEISASMLKEFNTQYALVGHSERRSYYGDTDASVAARYVQAQEQGIIPVLCVGETLEQREQDQTFSVINEQLDAVINLAGIASLSKAVIAYEPVWAIGTGKTATDEQAQEVHQYIRQYIAAKDQVIADKVQILYGGSAKPDNAKGLFAQPDIDGGLIGGASLEAESFLKIFSIGQVDKTIMYQVIIVIHVLLGLGVIGLVMMQQGKGADAGASFGSGSAGSVFGAQGAASFLSRATAILATSFFITSLGLAVINGHKGAAYDLMSGDSSSTEAPAVVEKKAEVQVEVPVIKETEVPKTEEIKTVK